MVLGSMAALSIPIWNPILKTIGICSWYQQMEACECLNAQEPTRGAQILKPHVHRLTDEPSAVSDTDPDLLFKIRFTAPVELKRIMVIGAGDPRHHPSKMRCFVNMPELDFTSVHDVQATQEFDLPVNQTGEALVHTVAGRFHGIVHLSLLFTENHGDEEQTKIGYIGLQGPHTHHQRIAVDATYEQLCTHDETGGTLTGSHVGKFSQLDAGGRDRS
mmetsp:Transcript_98567/g.226484  ORF Transcript_98567/g.226484 Transcript_98567/m.226484 type:complete len:217 (+) Transcript_98567:58-708(+)